MIEDNLTEKICDYCKDNQKGIYATKAEFIYFIKDVLNISIEEKMHLNEIKNIAYLNLTPKTINIYCAYLKFGLTRYEIHKISNKMTDYIITKLYQNDKLSVVHTYKSSLYSSSNYINVYSIKDILNLTANDIKTRKTKEIEMTDDNLAEALYIINKSAKVSRDTKTQAYEYGNFKICNSAKTRQVNLYNLKNKTLLKLDKQNKLKLIGIQKQIIDNKIIYLKLYEFKGYKFHLPIKENEINKNVPILDDILEEKISSDKRKTKITYNQAILLLKKFVQ